MADVVKVQRSLKPKGSALLYGRHRRNAAIVPLDSLPPAIREALRYREVVYCLGSWDGRWKLTKLTAAEDW